MIDLARHRAALLIRNVARRLAALVLDYSSLHARLARWLTVRAAFAGSSAHAHRVRRLLVSAALAGGSAHARRCRWLLVSAVLAVSSVHAAPPVLAIAGEPLAASCRADNAGRVDGPSLVHAAARPDESGTLYQSSMTTADWSGSFSRYAMASGAGGLSQAKQAAWEAGALLTGSASRPPSPAPERRQLYTSIVETDGTLTMTPFTWHALSPAQQAQLDPAHDGSGPQRLAWLRGDRSGEGVSFRRRSSVLGDSVHSTPVFVAQSAAAQSQERQPPSHVPTRALATVPGPASMTAAQRTDMIYLGANDGMLHAFDAGGGAEVFSYVPAALFDALFQLADPGYRHRAYVDGPARAGDVGIGASVRTVLVSGMGGGAQGVFALDVTDPLHFAEQGGVLWEFTDRHDALMGNVTGTPQLAKLRVGTQGGVPVYRHFAVVASGLNNNAADGYASATGDGALFLLALDKARNAPWRLGDNYYRLSAPIADPALPNALHAPAIVADAEGAARYAYAGDLQGNLWRFDLAGAIPGKAAGKSAGKSADGDAGTGSASLLFVARDASGRRQPIAQQPQVAYAADGGYLLLFGTGRLIEQADLDPARFAPQSYYAIRDTVRTPLERVTGRRQLTRRILVGDPASERLSLEGEAIEAGSMGWYVDLLASAATGERSLDSGVLLNGALAFTTMLPSADPDHPAECMPAHGRTYVLNVLTGLATGQSISARLPPTPDAAPPVVAEHTPRYLPRPLLLPVASVKPPAAREPTGRLDIAQDYAIGLAGPQAEPVLGTVHTHRRAGRLSWREVANWRQLHLAQAGQQGSEAQQKQQQSQQRRVQQFQQVQQAQHVQQLQQEQKVVP
ncbi:pilus assembly protein [Duganella sp. Leaf126]|uniref:pilus assembly protein n=1 Tax=Duganella sp. Leaf126 TaxID=1736266 RepID=UPI001E3A75A3|nr:PilC/PilY family type IV pilus protein [Duganella sp. Leaf126]